MVNKGRSYAAAHGGFDPQTVSVGEASPGYFPFPELPTLMRAVTPGVKLIAMLREPVSRAFSGFLQTHTAWSGVSFEAAIEREAAIIRQCEVLYPDVPTTKGSASASNTRYTRCIWPWFVAEVMEASLTDDFVGNREYEFHALPSRRCTAGMLRKQSVLVRSLCVGSHPTRYAL